MGTLANIVEIYERPLTVESDVTIDYTDDGGVVEKAEQVNIALKKVVAEESKRLGLENIRPINLPSEQAENLRGAIKSNPDWVDGFRTIVNMLAPELSGVNLDELSGPIRVPWWVAAPILRIEDKYDGSQGKLAVRGKISHTYVTQLMNAGKFAVLTQKKGDRDSMSISGVTITPDDLFVLGLRGGHRYSHTVMNVPAGSIEQGLFPTIYAEHQEELGLEKRDFSAVELLGRIYDPTIGHNTLYVARSRTKDSFGGVLKKWGSSEDRREYNFLLPLLNDPDWFLGQIEGRGYDPAKVNPDNPAATTLGNVGSILSVCVASLLLHFIQQEGPTWGREATKSLGDSYTFH